MLIQVIDVAKPACHPASIDCNDSMEGKLAILTIRDFDDELKTALRVRAAEHGRSMEAEVREILRAALTRRSPSAVGMATRIRQRFSGSANMQIELSDRTMQIELSDRTELPRAAELPE